MLSIPFLKGRIGKWVFALWHIILLRLHLIAYRLLSLLVLSPTLPFSFLLFSLLSLNTLIILPCYRTSDSGLAERVAVADEKGDLAGGANS